jgi:hypothetical protein
MFNDNQNYNSQNNQWDDVIDFLTEIAKDAVSVMNDMDFQEENNRVLASYDVFQIVRRIGRTEERFDTEMKNYIEIWKKENNANPYNSSNPPPIYISDLEKYRIELSIITEIIPELIVIKYGKEKITGWVLEKIKETAKKIVSQYGRNGRW